MIISPNYNNNTKINKYYYIYYDTEMFLCYLYLEKLIHCMTTHFVCDRGNFPSMIIKVEYFLVRWEQKHSNRQTDNDTI